MFQGIEISLCFNGTDTNHETDRKRSSYPLEIQVEKCPVLGCKTERKEKLLPNIEFPINV